MTYDAAKISIIYETTKCFRKNLMIIRIIIPSVYLAVSEIISYFAAEPE